MFDRILVPLDGSELAESIFPSLLPLAQKLGSTIVLVSVDEAGKEHESEGGFEAHVSGAAGGTARGPVQVLERTITGVSATGIRDYMAGVDAYLAKNEVKAEGTFAYGKVAQEILAQADATDCDLIAMSTRGRSGLKRGILGSVTDAVVRTSHIPVLVSSPGRTVDTGEGLETERELSRLVVPLDGSSLAEVVLPVVEELAQRLSLEVALVRVVRLAALAYAGMERIPMEVGDIQAELELEAKEYLNEIAGRMEPKAIRVTTAVLTGLPGRGIIDYMRGMEGAMAAMSTHARSGLPRMVLGSVADELIKGLDTPVLVVRPAPVESLNT